MQTGSIIDFYDDPQGLVLKQKLAAEQVPDFIKEAQFLEEPQRNSLPDDTYALVMVDRGEKFRKYACVDKGNTALSVMYFLENGDRLPEEAQKTAASNLLKACSWYDIRPPAQLMKAGSAELVKAASFDPYVDVTGKTPPPRIEEVAHQRFALVKEGQGQFPIDTYGDVIEADRWFNDHGETLHPEDRRELCTKLASRADEIGCKVSDYTRKYAGAGYAPDGEVRVAVATRMQYFSDDSPERGMLNGLMDKYAHVPPDVFCEAVRQFDEEHGLQHHWDEGVYDPWYTTYGFTKEAEWSFSTHGDKINEEQLNQLANASYAGIKAKFGDELANSFKKQPRQIFDSLPLDTKRILMRMANDPQPRNVHDLI